MIGPTNTRICTQMGASLVVTAPAGAYISATNGCIVRVRTMPSNGQVTFYGLTTGEWRVTASVIGEEPITKTVTIVSGYTVELKFFLAYITVNYPAGSRCSLWQNGWAEALVAEDQTGSWTFPISAIGTYYVDADDGVHYDSKTISITSDGQRETVTLAYNVIPGFLYTGDYQLVDDSDTVITTSKDNWKIRFLTSGELTMFENVAVDVFLVGGGGGSGSEQGGGGGGGRTKTITHITLNANEPVSVVVGAGGAGATSANTSGKTGSSSALGSYSVVGGDGGYSYSTTPSRTGGSGGSGGGKGGGQSDKTAGNGGSDGGDGYGGETTYTHGTGQHTTTREFGETNGKLYAGGGAGGDATNAVATGGEGGGGNEATNGAVNTGGGAGGNVINTSIGFSGGSGIVIIRNAR